MSSRSKKVEDEINIPIALSAFRDKKTRQVKDEINVPIALRDKD